MLNFLKQTRKFINAKEKTCIIIGNESCDLDSACSALCLAFFYQEQPTMAEKLTKAKNFLPVLNIPRRDYPLKTEVHYLLQKYNINEESITFVDELEAEFLSSNDFILVDHHVSQFASRCVAVFDHRPKDETANLPDSCVVNLELVGSCATLIGATVLNAIRDKLHSDCFKVPLKLLRSTIILDTVNFETAASRFTKKDQEICCCLEDILSANEKIESRESIFGSLRKARADVSTLTAGQLLRKDLKFIKTDDGKIKVALPGFPLHVQDFINKPNAEEDVRNFAIENKCDFIILLGMFVNDDGLVERDIGLINTSRNSLLPELIERSITESTNPALQLEKYITCDFMNGSFFKQQNIKATRKHILPIVKKALESFKTN